MGSGFLGPGAIPNPTTFGVSQVVQQPVNAAPVPVQEPLYIALANAGYTYFSQQAKNIKAQENRLMELENDAKFSELANGYRLAVMDIQKQADAQEFGSMEERDAFVTNNIQNITQPFLQKLQPSPEHYGKFQVYSEAVIGQAKEQNRAVHSALAFQNVVKQVDRSAQDQQAAVFTDPTAYAAVREQGITEIDLWGQEFGIPRPEVVKLQKARRAALGNSALAGAALRTGNDPEAKRAFAEALFTNDTKTYSFLEDIDEETQQASGVKLLAQAATIEEENRTGLWKQLKPQITPLINMAYSAGNAELITSDLIEQVRSVDPTGEYGDELQFAKDNAHFVKETVDLAKQYPAVTAREILQKRLDPRFDPQAQKDPFVFSHKKKLYDSALSFYNAQSEAIAADPVQFLGENGAQQYYNKLGVPPSDQVLLTRDEKTALTEELIQTAKLPGGQPNHAGLADFLDKYPTLTFKERKTLLKEAGLPADAYSTTVFLTQVATPSNKDYVLKALNHTSSMSLFSSMRPEEKADYREILAGDNRLNAYKQFMASNLAAEDATGFNDRFMKLVQNAVSMEVTASGIGGDIETAFTSAVNKLIPPMEKVGGGYIPATPNQAARVRNEVDKAFLEPSKLMVRYDNFDNPPPAQYRKSTTSLMPEARRKEQATVEASYWGAKTGIPADLLMAQMQKESRFIHMKDGKLLSSPAKALGISQFLPSTAKGIANTPEAKALGLTADLNDMHNAIGLQAVFMQRLLKQYDGSTYKALAHYNGGPKAVKYLEKTGWKYNPNAKEGSWAKETTKYINDIVTTRKAFAETLDVSAVVTLPTAIRQSQIKGNVKDKIRLLPDPKNPGSVIVRLPITDRDGVTRMYPVQRIGGEELRFNVGGE